MVPETTRVLIVDDSRIFRGILERAFADIPNVAILGSVFSGEKALEFVSATSVDLMTLDIEMPGLGGLATLKAIRELNRERASKPPIEVLLISSLTSQGARCTVEGLQLGAIDFVQKPNVGTEAENMAMIRKALTEKLNIYRLKRYGRSEAIAALAINAERAERAERAEGAERNDKANASASSLTASESDSPYQAIAIGISTGGPETLAQLLPQIAGRTQAPIFIIQHILCGLSKYMAESLGRRVGHEIMEASEGLVVRPGCIYMAQSGLHMVLRRKDGVVEIGLSDAPPENHSRPAVDVFLRSAAAIYGKSLIAAIMTGMLNDGASGVRAVKRAGGFVIAQDQSTSIIWGMPRAAIETGVVDLVLPLDQFAATFLKLMEGNRIQ